MGGSWAGLAAGTVAALVIALGAGAPAYADQTVPVHGTRFPDPTTAQLSYVGCDGLYQRTGQPVSAMVGRGPGTAPLGERSLGFDLAGGDAVGALYPVQSVLGTTTASLEVHSEGPATGVAYVGYQAPTDAGSDLLWLGRTTLSTPGGAWQTVDVAGRDFAWTQYDMSTQQPVGSRPPMTQPVAEFVAQHGGDGPGLYTVGFGCDGTPFNLDAFRVGHAGAVTSYDLEGLTTAVSMSRSGGDSDPVRLESHLTTGTGDAIPHATLLLEQSHSRSGPWTAAKVVPVVDGRATTVVDPQRPTYYRWRFVDRPLASGSLSPALLVDLTLPPPPSPSPSGTPSPTTHPSPTHGPSPTPSPTPSSTSSSPTGSPSPSATPSATPSASPDAASSATTSGSASASATRSPTASATTAESASPSGPSR